MAEKLLKATFNPNKQQEETPRWGLVAHWEDYAVDLYMGHEFESQLSHITFLAIGHKMISMAILSLLLIQILMKVCALSTGLLLWRSKPAQEQCEWISWWHLAWP